jgi:hypothetical protein
LELFRHRLSERAARRVRVGSPDAAARQRDLQGIAIGTFMSLDEGRAKIETDEEGPPIT